MRCGLRDARPLRNAPLSTALPPCPHAHPFQHSLPASALPQRARRPKALSSMLTDFGFHLSLPGSSFPPMSQAYASAAAPPREELWRQRAEASEALKSAREAVEREQRKRDAAADAVRASPERRSTTTTSGAPGDALPSPVTIARLALAHRSMQAWLIANLRLS